MVTLFRKQIDRYLGAPIGKIVDTVCSAGIYRGFHLRSFHGFNAVVDQDPRSQA